MKNHIEPKHIKHIVLDFGTRLGEGLNNILQIEGIDRKDPSYNIYTFEANPYTFQQIDFLDGINYYNMAVSVGSGFKTFNCEMGGDEITKDIDASGKYNEDSYIGGGSTLIPIDNWNCSYWYRNTDYWDSENRHNNYIQRSVYCMDIIELLLHLKIDLCNSKDCTVIAKFDIEGSEYSIFDKIQRHGYFKYFNKIYVEFHEWNMDGPNMPKSKGIHNTKNSHYWINYFKDNNIEYKVWG